MSNTTRSASTKQTSGYGLSLALTLMLNAGLVVAKETIPGLKSWMKAATSHHWITHALILTLVYVTLGLIFSRFTATRKVKPKTMVAVTMTSVIASTMIILGYYILHSLR